MKNRITRAQIRTQARQRIRDCDTKDHAIRAGLQIAATRAMPWASASGCMVAAVEIADGLAGMYKDSATLADRLARLVARRDWVSLWQAARREVYPRCA